MVAARSGSAKALVEAPTLVEAERKFIRWARKNGHVVGTVTLEKPERLAPAQLEGLEAVS
jgi:hypothetical protein